MADIPLDEFLVPMVLASDAVVRDGELIGDPTEGALVVLAAKGGIDAVSTRDRYPRIAELPFDAAYKLLSTVLSIFQTVLKTVRLDVRQWLICAAVALSIVAAAEIRKAVLRQTPVKAVLPRWRPRAGATTRWRAAGRGGSRD